jgi:hypothetical protein
MATPQLSPGVLVREVDLTVGRADNVLDNIGAIAGPFTKGPVEDPVTVSTEEELIQVFGKPSDTDGQYEYWMTASAFLSYGGILKVVRTNSDNIVNASSRTTQEGEITSLAQITTGIGSALDNNRTPGTYVLGQLGDLNNTGYGFTTNSANGTGAIIEVGIGQTGAVTSLTVVNNGSGYVNNDILYVNDTVAGSSSAIKLAFNVGGVVTEAGSASAGEVKIENEATYASNSDGVVPYIIAAKNPGTWANSLKVAVIDNFADQTLVVGSGVTNVTVGAAATVSISNVRKPVRRSGRNDTGGGFATETGFLKAIVTGVNAGAGTVDVVITSKVNSDGTEEKVVYQNRSRHASFKPGNRVQFSNGSNANLLTVDITEGNQIKDWYNEQFIALDTGNVFWKNIAPKPLTTQYALDRNGRGDAIHVAIFDEFGQISGIKGNLLEKFPNLSKATDTVSAVDAPTRLFYKDYVGTYSKYIWWGDNPSDISNNEVVVAGGFSSGITPYTTSQGLWHQPAREIWFSLLGNKSYTLAGGNDYVAPVTSASAASVIVAANNQVSVSAGSSVVAGSFRATLGELLNGYDYFANKDEIAVDYLLMGPGLEDKLESQAKAENLIAIARDRKDCIACISPHRADVVGDGTVFLSPDTITENVVEFFSTLSSSSYAIFDSGYKYTYDRFNNKFRYIPCNGDVAGLCVRTSIEAYPWFSPAGQQRGILNNAVKLAYNPDKSQRDELYVARVNPIITQRGIGTLLFGDKTALGYASAFDRINVRRLFLTVEQALAKLADAQLFELNDEITRSNFVNVVEPYLSDIQSKRGLYGYLVVCDESNNTPDVIDNNEFRADIYLKPTKSINYVTLTFVATRTGVSFEEVAGTV